MNINKTYFFIIKIKNYFLPFVFCLFTISLLVFSSSNLLAAKNGLKLWVSSVIPSLFPFFVATELLSKTNIPYLLGKIFNKFMKPLFNISGEGSFAVIMGWISGYPIGAKIASSFRNKKILSKEECERLLSFTNTSGPLFIVGTVGISLFGNIQIGILLLITHLLAAITVGFLFRFWKYSPHQKNNNSIKQFSSNNHLNVNFKNLGGILGECIYNSISTILMIGGFIVLFSVIVSILNKSKFLYLASYLLNPLINFMHIPSSFSSPILTGIIEVTNGISQVANIKIKAISINIILTAFLLGFGGISILLQVLNVISKTDLSIKPYIIGKILHANIAALYTFILINLVPFLNYNL